MSDRATLERSLKVLYERGEYEKAAVIARELENFKESPALDTSAGATAKRSALRGEKNMNELLLGAGERVARFSPAKTLYTKMAYGKASPYIGTPGKMEFEKRPPEDNTLLGIASEYAYPTSLAAGGRYIKSAAQGGGLLRSLTKPVAEVASGGASAVGGYVGQRLGGDKGEMVGSIGPPLVWGLLQGGLRSALAAKFGINKKEAQRRIDVVTEAVGPERADDILSASVLGGEGARATENVIQSGPGGAIPAHVKTAHTQDALYRARTGLINSISEGSGPSSAGKAMLRAVQRGKKQKQDIGKRLGMARSGIPDDATTVAPHLDDAIGRLRSKVAIPPDVRNPKAAKEAARAFQNSTESPTAPMLRKYEALKKAGDGEVTWGTLKTFYDDVSTKLKPQYTALNPGADVGELKLLRAAVKDDMKHLAAQYGKSKEIARLEREYAKHTQRMELGIQKIVGKLSKEFGTEATPEAVFKRLVAESRGKFGGGTKLARAKNVMSPDEWAAVQAAVIRGMGQSKGAAGEIPWSYARFLSDWNDLSKPAKKVLFTGGKMSGDYAKNMDKLSAMVETTRYLKEASEILANPSGTAGRGITTATEVAKLYQLLGGNIKGWARLNVVTLSFRGTGKLMGNPKFVRWLAGTSKMSNDKIPGYIARLSEIAASSPDTADEIKELKAILAGQFAND